MPPTLHIETPSRLHFGLLARDPDASRQYGGVGLMIARPRLVLEARRAATFEATGPLAERARAFAEQAAARLEGAPAGVHLRVVQAPRSHAGFGSGTQLGLAVARAVAALAGPDEPAVAELAALAGRGERSAIGAHGFMRGGLIVEGGKADPDAISPMLVRAAFPDAWRIVVISPEGLTGVAGRAEREAFQRMPRVPTEATAEMCRLVLLGLVPALCEADLDGFGEALYRLQRTVGRCFASEQGGVYASPRLGEIVDFVRDRGVRGVGQSSWGPTLYAVLAGESAARDLAAAVRQRFGLGQREVWVTAADNEGARLTCRGAGARAGRP